MSAGPWSFRPADLGPVPCPAWTAALPPGERDRPSEELPVTNGVRPGVPRPSGAHVAEALRSPEVPRDGF